MMARKSGRRNQQMTALVLAAKGTVCAIGGPGCTKVATTRDHIVPLAQGGRDSVENCRPACRACNSRRGNRTMGQRVHIVTGPPAAGKSTYVREHAGPLDVIVDLDRIASAISAEGMDTHGYPDHIRHVAIGMRSAAIARATRLREPVDVWVIHSIPTPDTLAEYRAHGWHIVTCDPGRDVVLARAAAERPASSLAVIARWYEREQIETREDDGQLAKPSRSW